jgi:hypothetical protein
MKFFFIVPVPAKSFGSDRIRIHNTAPSPFFRGQSMEMARRPRCLCLLMEAGGKEMSSWDNCFKCES